MRRQLLCPIVALTLALLACNTLLPPRPEVDWDTDPQALVVSADTCCGMLYDPNGIPTARLWGDGRLIWVAVESSGARRVLTAALTTDQMKALLQRFVDSGFFGWQDSYRPSYEVYDAPSTCLHVALQSASKSVCDLMGNAPAAFYELLDGLAAGLTETNYVPTRAYLQANPVGSASLAPVLQWPADSLNLSLKDASQGVWVEGKTLEVAWRAVNERPYNALVQEGDTFFSLVLLVPDVTRQQPPAP